MSFNIKNEDVHAAVRELADALGVSQTSAVEVAVRAKLAEMQAEREHETRAARMNDAIDALQQAFRDAPDDGYDPWAVLEDLYDPETGLPR